MVNDNNPNIRIDSNELGIDDVAIVKPSLFRLERMNEGSFWIQLYMSDGTSHRFCVSSHTPITVTHETENG